MRRHGATVAAQNLTELVFRTIYSYRNAELQLTVQGAGPAAQPAHAGRGEDGLGPQPRAAAAGARLGILVDAAEEGRRISGRRTESCVESPQPGRFGAARRKRLASRKKR